LCSRAPLINMASGMMLYFNIGAQASQKKALALLGGVYSVGQADERSAIMPAPLNPLNQTTKMR